MTISLSEVFATDGLLAASIPGYRARAQQVEMAQRIGAAIAQNTVLVAEAGTGTGKTFAYLVPALLSGGKVIVSTGTKNLQDQLFARDIPTVRQALGSPVRVALLKGRANYVCHYHLENALADGRFVAREDAAHAHRIARFAKTSKTGDKADCGEVPENSPVWGMVTSTRENCLGQDCPQHKECFVLAARREALAADLVVVNHHLFFADVMLRDEGTAELLPACNTVIFDEAHQLPETASLFFGDNVSTSQILDLARDARGEGLTSARDCLDLPKFCGALEKAAKDLRLTLPIEPARFSLAQLEERAGFDNNLVGLLRELSALGALLETQAQRSEGLENCWRRAGELSAQLRRWQAGADGDYVRWGETYTHSLQLNATPLVIAKIMQKQMSGNGTHPRAWIFTSATLAVQKDFGHYCAEMGLEGADSACWDSPFDYAQQAMLYAPQGLPDPNSPGYIEAVVNAAFPVLKASGGRAFFLCTSLRAMRRTHEMLGAELARAGLDFPLLLQGEGSKNELLERFRRLGNAILVASQSFWEGVDVRGEALSLVVIDKLPFAPPDDPVLSARLDRMKADGRNAFMDYQLPRAVINVKQGAGRLIRDETDRGVLMICDPRLISKPYGKRVWRSLPPMKRTREIADVLSFFEEAMNLPREPQVDAMPAGDCLDAAALLNRDCACRSVNHDELKRALEGEAGGLSYDALRLTHPHLFSDTRVYVAQQHLDFMAGLVRVIEAVVGLPAWRERVLDGAPEIARHDPKTAGVMLGYDFHLGDDGPRLIEINTNAGGALLNSRLLAAQRACALSDPLPAVSSADPRRVEDDFAAMFREEWARARAGAVLGRIAIVDESPQQQFLAPEFELFRQLFEKAGIAALIADPAELSFDGQALWCRGLRVDLVYNRLTDFALDEPGHGALCAAYLGNKVVVTPHPRAHALYADKGNLVALCDDPWLASIGVSAAERALLARGVPKTTLVTPDSAGAFWASRRQWFFKPRAGFGSRAAYRGDKLTRRVFDEIAQGGYIAQALVRPSERRVLIDGDLHNLKLDLRNYVYRDRVQLVSARLYQGQTTNFRTRGGGFAAVFAVPCAADALSR